MNNGPECNGLQYAYVNARAVTLVTKESLQSDKALASPMCTILRSSNFCFKATRCDGYIQGNCVIREQRILATRLSGLEGRLKGTDALLRQRCFQISRPSRKHYIVKKTTTSPWSWSANLHNLIKGWLIEQLVSQCHGRRVYTAAMEKGHPGFSEVYHNACLIEWLTPLNDVRSLKSHVRAFGNYSI